MVLSNAERQARYKQRLKEAASPAWIRKDFGRGNEAQETIASFAEFFGRVPRPGSLEVYSRTDRENGAVSLLVKLPWPLGANDAEMMIGWRAAKEDAADLGFWHREI